MAADTSYSSPFRTTQVLPRLGTSKTLGERWTAFAQVSTGFSDPTNFESLSTDDAGRLPSVLDAERAWTLEVGARHTLGEVVVYHQQVQRAIVQDVDSNGAQIFVNTNAPITMQGVEWQVGNRGDAIRSMPRARPNSTVGTKATCQVPRGGWPTSNTAGPFGTETTRGPGSLGYARSAPRP